MNNKTSCILSCLAQEKACDCVCLSGVREAEGLRGVTSKKTLMYKCGEWGVTS